MRWVTWALNGGFFNGDWWTLPWGIFDGYITFNITHISGGGWFLFLGCESHPKRCWPFWQHVLHSIGMWDVKWCEPRCIPLFIIIFPIVWSFFSQKLQDSANFFSHQFSKNNFPSFLPVTGPSIFQNKRAAIAEEERSSREAWDLGQDWDVEKPGQPDLGSRLV